MHGTHIIDLYAQEGLLTNTLQQAVSDGDLTQSDVLQIDEGAQQEAQESEQPVAEQQVTTTPVGEEIVPIQEAPVVEPVVVPQAGQMSGQPVVEQQVTTTPVDEEPQPAPVEIVPMQEVPVVQPQEVEPVELPQEVAPVSTEVPEQPEVPTEPKPTIEEIEGIDTVDLDEPRGNWLFKRIWWERAERKYEKIRLAVASIFETRMNFFQQRTYLDRDVFDPFYLEIGLSQGELQEVIDELIRKLEQERATQGDLDSQERVLLETLRVEKQTLERIKKDINLINQLDNDVENSLNKLLDQINRVRNYEREAWTQFKDIARVLSDKKARDLYHAMDVTWQNIKDIRDYIEQAFTQHFNQIVSTAQQQVETIKSEVQELKDKGIDLKQEAEKLIATYSQELETERTDEEEEDQEIVSNGFMSSLFATIGSTFKTVWNSIISIITWPFTKLFGSSEQYEEDYEVEEKDIAYNDAELPTRKRGLF